MAKVSRCEENPSPQIHSPRSDSGQWLWACLKSSVSLGNLDNTNCTRDLVSPWLQLFSCRPHDCLGRGQRSGGNRENPAYQLNSSMGGKVSQGPVLGQNNHGGQETQLAQKIKLGRWTEVQAKDGAKGAAAEAPFQSRVRVGPQPNPIPWPSPNLERLPLPFPTHHQGRPGEERKKPAGERLYNGSQPACHIAQPEVH